MAACSFADRVGGFGAMPLFGKTRMTPVDAAVHAVRRENFLPEDQKPRAGNDAPLPIGYDQTISQPSLVAEMTRQLAINSESCVLEIGTGSGYQTAILAEIAAEVFTIERVPELAQAARARLEKLGYRNIRFRTGDGAQGWPEAAPFNGIIVTAAPAAIPPLLIAQLAQGGRMIIPVGPGPDSQTLLLLEKDAQGHVHRHELFAVRFVPLR